MATIKGFPDSKGPSRVILLLGFSFTVLAGVLFLVAGRKWYPDLSEHCGVIGKLFLALGGTGLLGLGLEKIFRKPMEDPGFKNLCALIGSIVAIIGGTTFLLIPGIIGASGDSGYVAQTSGFGVLYILIGAFGLVTSLILTIRRRTHEHQEPDHKDEDH